MELDKLKSYNFNEYLDQVKNKFLRDFNPKTTMSIKVESKDKFKTYLSDYKGVDSTKSKKLKDKYNQQVNRIKILQEHSFRVDFNQASHDLVKVAKNISFYNNINQIKETNEKIAKEVQMNREK